MNFLKFSNFLGIPSSSTPTVIVKGGVCVADNKILHAGIWLEISKIGLDFDGFEGWDDLQNRHENRGSRPSDLDFSVPSCFIGDRESLCQFLAKSVFPTTFAKFFDEKP